MHSSRLGVLLILVLTGACRNLDEDVGESKYLRDVPQVGAVPEELKQVATAPGLEQKGAAAPQTPPPQVSDTSGKRIRAEANFVASPGIKLRGEAELREVPGGVRIEVDIEDAPAGPKGIHIHQNGDCSNIPGKSMGEHLATTDDTHGLPSSPHHHAGDMGNIEVDKDGEGKLTFVVPAVHLKGHDARSLAHRAIVIHEKQDSGPGGSSGKPIACAVIQPS